MAFSCFKSDRAASARPSIPSLRWTMRFGRHDRTNLDVVYVRSTVRQRRLSTYKLIYLINKRCFALCPMSSLAANRWQLRSFILQSLILMS
jgi:hypothetical protein